MEHLSTSEKSFSPLFFFEVKLTKQKSMMCSFEGHQKGWKCMSYRVLFCAEVKVLCEYKNKVIIKNKFSYMLIKTIVLEVNMDGIEYK